MSISPLRGHAPYTSASGIIQMAGHSHEPRGILATTSTFPYRIVLLPLVLMRALRTGLMSVPAVLLLRMEHAPMSSRGWVHVPSVVRFRT